MSGRSSQCGATTTRTLRTAGSTLGRFVALKVLPPHVMSRPDALSRFERELIYLIEYDDGRTAVLTPQRVRREVRLEERSGQNRTAGEVSRWEMGLGEMGSGNVGKPKNGTRPHIAAERK